MRKTRRLTKKQMKKHMIIGSKKRTHRNHKNIKHNNKKLKSIKTRRGGRYGKIRGMRRMRRTRNRRNRLMRGGMADIKAQNTILGKKIPYLPPGGPYKPGQTNGLGSGYYYEYNTNPYLPDPHPYWQGYGGGLMDLVPQDLRNFGRNVSTKIQNFGKTWQGEPPVESPNVMDQPIGKYKAKIENVSDIPKIYNKNVKNVSNK